MTAWPASWKHLALAAGAALALWGLYALARPKGVRVFNRQRAAGVHPKLLAFLDWWEAHGGFPITVVAEGGVRTDAAKQLSFFQRGVSKAATLQETPHGRGGALDLAPADVKGGAVFTGVDTLFHAIGAAARAFDLAWGGDWTSFKDLPHVELRDWRTLPFPPKY